MSSLSTWTWHFVQKVWLFGIKDFSISISSELVFLVWSRGTVQLTNQIPRAMSQGYIQHARKHMGVHAVCMNIYMDNMWLSRTLSVGVFTFTERLSVSVCCHLWDVTLWIHNGMLHSSYQESSGYSAWLCNTEWIRFTGVITPSGANYMFSW